MVVNSARGVTSVQVHGPVLRHVREGRRRTIGQLARCAGVSTSFLAAVERGDRRGVGVGVFHALVQELDLADARILLVNPYAEDVAQVTGTSQAQSGSRTVPSRCKIRTTRAA